MLGRKRGGEGAAPCLGAGVRTVETSHIDAIGGHGGIAAIDPPQREPRGIVEKVEQDRLVIALEEVCREPLRQPAQQNVDHLPALWPPIHIVAEKDERPVRCVSASRRVGRDRREEAAQQIGPSVNIADRIEQLAFGQRRMVQALRSGERHGRLHSNAKGGWEASNLWAGKRIGCFARETCRVPRVHLHVFSDLPVSSRYSRAGSPNTVVTQSTLSPMNRTISPLRSWSSSVMT